MGGVSSVAAHGLVAVLATDVVLHAARAEVLARRIDYLLLSLRRLVAAKSDTS